MKIKGDEIKVPTGNEIPNDDGNPFLTLRGLLGINVKVATLATAIEEYGVYSWDRFGRFRRFGSETDRGKRALDILAGVRHFETYCQGPTDQQHPLDAAEGPDDPFWEFGWASEVAPSFELLSADQDELPMRSDPRPALTDRHIIGALLALIEGEVGKLGRHPAYKDRTKLVDLLVDEFDGYRGMTAGTLFPRLKESFLVAEASIKKPEPKRRSRK